MRRSIKSGGSARSSEKSAGKIVLIILVCALLLTAALVILNYWEKSQSTFLAGSTAGAAAEDMGGYVLNENIQTFLIIGLDKYEEDIDDDGYYNNQQADVLLLLVIDDEKKTCNIIQINRDTMTEVGILGVAGTRINTVTEQIALAHTYGNGREQSCVNTVRSVSELLNDIDVDHYIAVTLDAVPVLNDLVGGVEVEVLDDFADAYVPDPTLVKGETVTLHGEHALNYVRGRWGVGDSTNLTRMERQRQYMNAFYEKARQMMQDDEDFSLSAITEISDYILSDCNINKLSELAEKAGEYEMGEIYALEGESVLGENFMEFYPDEEKLDELVTKLFYVNESEE